MTNGVAGTFVTGTDERTIKFTATTEKVGDVAEFTVAGKTLRGRVAVVNGADSFATIQL